MARAQAMADSLLDDIESKMQNVLQRAYAPPGSAIGFRSTFAAESDTTRSTRTKCEAARSARDAAAANYVAAGADFANRIRTSPRSLQALAATALWGIVHVGLAWWQYDAAADAYEECMAAANP